MFVSKGEPLQRSSVMLSRKPFVVLVGAVILTLHATSSYRPALAGPAWGPPGWPNLPLDPSGPPKPAPQPQPQPVEPSTGTVHGK